MNAEYEFLASAYVDGDLTDDERRLAEADPAVMAEVDRFRALRSGLADVPPPSDAARESALAAAMGAFHEQYGAAPSAARPPAPPASPVTNVVSFWRRPIAMQLLGAAAAVAVIGLLGVVIVSGIRSGDDDSVDVAGDAAAEEPADEPAEDRGEAAPAEAPITESLDQDVAASEAAPEFADDAAADEPAMEADGGAAADDIAAEEPAEEAMADEPFGDDADDAASDLAVDASRFFGFETTDEPLAIASSDELAAAGTYLADIERTRPELLGATPESACGPALANATVLVGDTPTAVVIVLDTEGGWVVAFDETCLAVLDAPYAP